MIDKVIKWFDSESGKSSYFNVPDEIYAMISKEEAIYLASRFSNTHMIKLPESEIRFFEWLKLEDIEVWNDLWQSELDEEYYVGMSFLPYIIDKNVGFPICDLLNNDNYYFTHSHIVDKESEILLESIKTRFLNKQVLTVAHLLLLNISFTAQDIWHFAYRNKISLKDAKRAVEILVEDQVLVHLKEAEHLAGFVEL